MKKTKQEKLPKLEKPTCLLCCLSVSCSWMDRRTTDIKHLPPPAESRGVNSRLIIVAELIKPSIPVHSLEHQNNSFPFIGIKGAHTNNTKKSEK